MSNRLRNLLKWSIPFLLLAALLLWYATPLSDQPAALIPREVLFGYPSRTAPKLSPDGKQIAYLAPDNRGVLNIWTAPVDNLAQSSQVTQDKKRGVRRYLWQGDGQHIVYLQDSDGDENWHLLQIDTQALVTRDLTPFAGSRVQIIAYEADKPDQMLVSLNLRDKSYADVYRLNLDTGALERDSENRQQFRHFLADHNLQVRLAERFTKNGGQEILARDDSNSPWRPLISWGPEEGIGSAVAFSPDNEAVYILSSLGHDTVRLLSVDLNTGRRSAIAHDPEYDLEGILIHPTTHILQAAAIDRDKPDYIALDPVFEQDLQWIKRVLGSHFDITSRSYDDQRWIIASRSDTKPLEYHLYDRSTQQIQKLFTTRPGLEKYRLSEMQPISFTARDGMTIHGYLTLPVGAKPKNLPTVLLVHGGPWLRDSWGLDLEVQWLANRGYAVLQVNYRGSTGYGKSHLNAGNKEWGWKDARRPHRCQKLARNTGVRRSKQICHLWRQLRRLRHIGWASLHSRPVLLRRRPPWHLQSGKLPANTTRALEGRQSSF